MNDGLPRRRLAVEEQQVDERWGDEERRSKPDLAVGARGRSADSRGGSITQAAYQGLVYCNNGAWADV
ncbi:hypothetical protein A7C99_4230 [Trichophyton rubrum]|uniref:Uncharacterized protein n=1 Tax=Trichophyton rubrum TaxID=5551 RepID=A0A178EXR5_TRIRU|nr:hypothetical protein A7C99_4230 [Trichophyton rubrum]